jgi:hypothetical protein
VKLVYTYNANENIKLSGNINTSGYDYYINDYYLSNISSKSYTKFNRFYLDSNYTGEIFYGEESENRNNYRKWILTTQTPGIYTIKNVVKYNSKIYSYEIYSYEIYSYKIYNNNRSNTLEVTL